MDRYGSLRTLVFLIAVTATLFWGCDPPGYGRLSKADAVAVLMPTEGNIITGSVTFFKVKEGVRVIVDVIGLSPGEHGVHIHEFGDCRADDGSSAGGHFNPLGRPHGAPDAENRHMGDMGNLKADENGAALLDIIDPLLALDGANSIIGRSVVVHAQADDFTTQPHGATGARLACGTIGMARK